MSSERFLCFLIDFLARVCNISVTVNDMIFDQPILEDTNKNALTITINFITINMITSCKTPSDTIYCKYC